MTQRSDGQVSRHRPPYWVTTEVRERDAAVERVGGTDCEITESACVCVSACVSVYVCVLSQFPKKGVLLLAAVSPPPSCLSLRRSRRRSQRHSRSGISRCSLGSARLGSVSSAEVRFQPAPSGGGNTNCQTEINTKLRSKGETEDAGCNCKCRAEGGTTNRGRGRGRRSGK